MPDRLAVRSNHAVVLVIDPSLADRAQICDCLNQLPDIKVIAAGEAEQALQIVREVRPSMILLDSAQKGIDGISLTRAIRNWEQAGGSAAYAPWTPIVFLSSINDENLLAQGILAGGDDFICKPVSEVVLLAKVRAMLRIAARQREICDVHHQLKDIATLPGADLINTRWQLSALGNEILDPASQQAPYLTLDSEGKVRGHAGCNGLNGSYQHDDDSLSFGAIATTRKACPDMEGEQAFLQALKASRQFRIDGELLTLFDANNQPLAGFQAIAL